MKAYICYSALYIDIDTNGMNLFHSLSKVGVNVLFFFLLIFTIYYLINIGNNYVAYRKKLKLSRKNNLIITLFILASLMVWIIITFRGLLISILIPILWAVVFAYLINPLVNKLTEFNLSRMWSVIIIYVVISIFIIALSITIIPKMSREVMEFAESLPKYANEAIEFSNNIYTKYLNSVNSLPREFIGIDVALREYLNNTQVYIMDFFKNITEKGLNIFSNIVGIVLVPIYTFYFLKDTSFFRRKILLSVPKTSRNELRSIFKDINKLLNNFIRGQLLVAAMVGVISIVVLFILKVEFALIIGAIAGLGNVIPYFGPIIGAIPAVIIAFLDEPIKALWVSIAFFGIQQVESAILQPKIVGDSVGLHPVFVIIALLIGGELFGIAGLLFSVPIAASIKIVLKHIVKIMVKI